jgi:hypothetical protein
MRFREVSGDFTCGRERKVYTNIKRAGDTTHGGDFYLIKK